MCRNCLAILVLAVSFVWVLFMQDQTNVFDIGPTADLPEMMTAADNNATNVEEPEQQPANNTDPVVALLAPSPTAPWQVPINVNDWPRLDHQLPGLAGFLLNNPPTAPPAECSQGKDGRKIISCLRSRPGEPNESTDAVAADGSLCSRPGIAS